MILFSGPYEAMWTVHQTPAARLAFWIIALATVFFTAMYLFRGIVSLFQKGIAVSGIDRTATVVFHPARASSC